MTKRLVISALAALALAAPARRGASLDVLETPKLTLIEWRENIIKDAEARIQKDILDPMLGKDKGTVFADVEIEVKAQRRENAKEGAGIAEKYKEKGEKGQGMGREWALPGVPTPKNITNITAKPRPEAAVGQSASQTKSEQEEYYAQDLVFRKLKVTVFHDSRVDDKKIKDVRDFIVEAMAKYKDAGGAAKLVPDDVAFKKMKYHQSSAAADKNWMDDLKEPKVYLPLLYAALLLLLLLFLFFPFAGFMRRYVEAIAQKPAAQINVESNIEPPEGEGKGGAGGAGGAGGPGEGKLDVMFGQKPPASEEEDMSQWFSYINETNLKRLVILFLLRREEPWLIAVVLSYLRPEYARQVLMALPVGMQAKVAMEALMVRQCTREQVAAIDSDIKESVNFLVGGIERLTQMLEEADTPTRANILEYLKNEKPAVYERVRKRVLLFEDIANFPDRDMQTIIRELQPDDMARALMGAPPDVASKFFANMSEGAGSLLKESMEYSQGVTPAQAEDERTKILDKIKAMEKDGKVAVRPKVEDEGFQDVLATSSRRPAGRKEESAAEPAAPSKSEETARIDAAEARRCFDAGLEQHEAGNLDEAVRCFRQAIEHDPDLWQACQYLGSELFQMGRIPEALMYYEKALSYNPDPSLRSWLDSYKAQMKESPAT
ncbi:MAG: hypothetical protein HY922_01570 [Elusimicrobia bacterium]|nr:hypothetical protein [Elusimicrobiota bacterium]